MGNSLVSLDVYVNTAVETLVVEAVLCAGVEAVLTAFFEAFLAAVVAAVVLEDADFLFSAYASGTATVVFSGGDADVLTDVLLVTGRAGLLGMRLMLTFPSSALDRYLLLSLDLFGLLVVFVGRRKDAERDSGRVLAVGCLGSACRADVPFLLHECPAHSFATPSTVSTYGILASKSSLATLGGLGHFARQQRDLQSRQGRREADGCVFKCGDLWEPACCGLEDCGQWPMDDLLQVVECFGRGSCVLLEMGQPEDEGSVVDCA
jgi:hypothetical protein